MSRTTRSYQRAHACLLRCRMPEIFRKLLCCVKHLTQCVRIPLHSFLVHKTLQHRKQSRKRQCRAQYTAAMSHKQVGWSVFVCPVSKVRSKLLMVEKESGREETFECSQKCCCYVSSEFLFKLFCSRRSFLKEKIKICLTVIEVSVCGHEGMFLCAMYRPCSVERAYTGCCMVETRSIFSR